MPYEKISENTWTTTVDQDSETGEFFITLPEELLKKLGWTEGTPLIWTVDEQGQVVLSKADTDNPSLNLGSTDTL